MVKYFGISIADKLTFKIQIQDPVNKELEMIAGLTRCKRRTMPRVATSITLWCNISMHLNSFDSIGSLFLT